MTTKTQKNVLDQNDRDELVDISITLGQHCWDIYCKSKGGRLVVGLLPGDLVRQRARELYQLGFSARMIMFPPVGIAEKDAAEETTLVEKAWEPYLHSMNGKTVLDGPAYPDTPKVVLRVAKCFFFDGFRAGTTAVLTILDS